VTYLQQSYYESKNNDKENWPKRSLLVREWQKIQKIAFTTIAANWLRQENPAGKACIDG